MRKLGIASIALVLILTSGTAAFAQRGRGGRGAAPPPPEEMQDVVNRIIELVNSRNTEGLTAMIDPAGVYLDEDGHQLPATLWAGRVAGGEGPRMLASTGGVRGEILGDTGWVSFNYTYEETYEGQPLTIRGTASLVLARSNGAWMIHMFHGAMEQHVAGFAGTQE